LIFTATADGWLDLGDRKVRCALGPAGVKPAPDKREGDGASPAGVWPIREVWYRPDRGPPPACELRVRAMAPDDGWCDDPADPAYNRHVKLPYPASAEHLWREDEIYDIVVVLGHNDDPPFPGLGSCIFLHLNRPDYPPTQGCVAIARADLEELLGRAQPGDAVEIAVAAA
jgi:L,D-peptidoglycan transpeptidase YkuD (ErfK/YbiS/YcfS/YnhG family)